MGGHFSVTSARHWPADEWSDEEENIRKQVHFCELVNNLELNWRSQEEYIRRLRKGERKNLNGPVSMFEE